MEVLFVLLVSTVLKDLSHHYLALQVSIMEFIKQLT